MAETREPALAPPTSTWRPLGDGGPLRPIPTRFGDDFGDDLAMAELNIDLATLWFPLLVTLLTVLALVGVSSPCVKAIDFGIRIVHRGFIKPSFRR
jgi:hypothetical protein